MKSRSLILPRFFSRCSTTPSVLKVFDYPQSKRRPRWQVERKKNTK
uniref:Uncharacterized protein n=1 Tax=Anguilla anguilla TaxID=7936 RepID=A0A0E9S6B6_ANGAN